MAVGTQSASPFLPGAPLLLALPFLHVRMAVHPAVLVRAVATLAATARGLAARGPRATGLTRGVAP